MDVMVMGDKIKRARLGMRISARALGQAAGCSPTTIGEIEDGVTANPGVWRIRRIAETLGVSMDWLTDDSADWPPPPSTDDRIVQSVREAMARSQSSGRLSDAEHRLIELFRRLDDGGRREVSGYAAAVAARTSGSERSVEEYRSRTEERLAELDGREHPADADNARPSSRRRPAAG